MRIANVFNVGFRQITFVVVGDDDYVRVQIKFSDLNSLYIMGGINPKKHVIAAIMHVPSFCDLLPILVSD